MQHVLSCRLMPTSRSKSGLLETLNKTELQALFRFSAAGRSADAGLSLSA